MKYHPEQVDLLAAEYVIGTLHGRARRRFEALMRQRADIRFSVWDWERRLSGIAAAIEPVAPPEQIWRNISQRITTPTRSRSKVTSWWPRFAIAASIVAAVAIWMGTTIVPTTDADRIAIFADDNAQALWIIRADFDDSAIVVETIGAPPIDDDLVYELWSLPPSGTPQSLGLLELEAGVRDSTLSAPMLDVLRVSANLAISLEPRGGSPTGLPTGPVVYQASLVQL